MNTTWTIQHLGPVRGDMYPYWQAYSIRDTKTNVHIATVGHVDRYFEGQTFEHAKLIAAAPELLVTCEALCEGIDELMGRLAKDAPELLPDRVDVEPWATILKARAAIAKAKNQ